MNTPNTELERIKKLVIDVAAEVDTHQDGDAFIRTYSFNEVQLQVFAQTYAKHEVEKALLAEKDNGETDRPINNERE